MGAGRSAPLRGASRYTVGAGSLPRAAIMRIRESWRPVVLVTTVLCGWLWVAHARSQQDLQSSDDAGEKAEFYWSRLRYTSANDYGGGGGRGFGYGYSFSGWSR